MIDTHAHIYSEEFQDDINEVLLRAKEAGVKMILMPNIDTSSIPALYRLEQNDILPCKPMMGLHPCYVQSGSYQSELAVIKKTLFDNPARFVAVGEIGMDLYWDLTTQDIQEEAFRIQIEWALELGLPINIHSRNATRQCIDILKSYSNPKLRGTFHCFSGTKEEAKEIVELGFTFGIGGVVTFKNSGLEQVLEEIPLDRILLETDAPYLAPTPYRGKRNEPSYLKEVIKKIASVKKVDENVLADILDQNVRKLFAVTEKELMEYSNELDFPKGDQRIINN